jgi:hypothetical protein
VILGYPWFTTAQPKIDWVQGWIDHSQLPIVLRSHDAAKAQFQARTTQVLLMRICQGEVTPLKKRVPPQYHQHLKVFSNKESKKLPPEQPWDHAIDLREGAPVTLISKNIRLSQLEQVELRKFIKEHLARGTIRPSKSPYTAAFFFIKKKDRQLQPVQDY